MLAALALIAVLPRLPAAAGERLAPPKGCEGVLTAQLRGCVVSNHFTCGSDPKGDRWRVDSDAYGPFFASRIDAETQWIETFDLEAGQHQRLVPGAARPASFTTLMRTGEDRYDFVTKGDDGSREHVTGFDRLTGAARVVSGFRLEEADYSSTARDPSGHLLWQSRGQEFVSRKLRLFFPGKGTWRDADGTTEFDNSPVALITRGGRGFLNARPDYGCDTVLSAYVPPPAVPRAVIGRHAR